MGSQQKVTAHGEVRTHEGVSQRMQQKLLGLSPSPLTARDARVWAPRAGDALMLPSEATPCESPKKPRETQARAALGEHGQQQRW